MFYLNDVGGLVYCAYFHPELWRENGRVMVFTYCVSGGKNRLKVLIYVYSWRWTSIHGGSRVESKINKLDPSNLNLPKDSK